MKEVIIRELPLKVLTLEGERLLLIGRIIEDFMKILALVLDFIKTYRVSEGVRHR